MGTQGVGHGDTGSGTWGHREWGMGIYGMGHGNTGSVAWGHREWGIETL